MQKIVTFKKTIKLQIRNITGSTNITALEDSYFLIEQR